MLGGLVGAWPLGGVAACWSCSIYPGVGVGVLGMLDRVFTWGGVAAAWGTFLQPCHFC